MDGGGLREGLRDLLRTVRVVRRQQPEHGPVPAGMAGVLAAISETAGTAGGAGRPWRAATSRTSPCGVRWTRPRSAEPSRRRCGWGRHDLELFAALLRRLNHDVVRHVESETQTMEAAR